jgi:inosine-uridine nucleoside N-ribohydrolase
MNIMYLINARKDKYVNWVKEMRRIIIDTDPGIDDTAAILLALASPELFIEAITTVYGNGVIEDCTRNALIILEKSGRMDIPVYQGVSKPLLRESRIAVHVHGKDALGDVGLGSPTTTPQDNHAVFELIDRIMNSPGEITLLAIGPLTNIALALSIEPNLANALDQLIVMGGAVLTHGNSSEVASANLYNDPEAASIVYQSGAPVIQVGLDVCQRAIITSKQLESIKQAETPTTKLLAKITTKLASFYDSIGYLKPGIAVWYNDMPAIAFAIDDSLFKIQEYHVRISTHDELTKGQTVADIAKRFGRLPNTKVLMGVETKKLTKMFTERVVSYSETQKN